MRIKKCMDTLQILQHRGVFKFLYACVRVRMDPRKNAAGASDAAADNASDEAACAESSNGSMSRLLQASTAAVRVTLPVSTSLCLYMDH